MLLLTLRRGQTKETQFWEEFPKRMTVRKQQLFDLMKEESCKKRCHFLIPKLKNRFVYFFDNFLFREAFKRVLDFSKLDHGGKYMN